MNQSHRSVPKSLSTWVWVGMLIAIQFWPLLSPAQKYCIFGRFGPWNAFSFSDVEVETDVPYRTAVDYVGDSVVLDYNAFYPDLSLDTLSHRPFILFIHGGGFYTGDKSDSDFEAWSAARRGFVTATINYRQGWDIGGAAPTECLGDTHSFNRAIYRVVQDINGALAHFADSADRYGIDTAWMAIAGRSAGSVAALWSHFMSAEDWESHFPDAHLADSMGPPRPENAPRARAIFNLWGALPDTHLITTDNRIPVFSLHGTADTNVHFIQGNLHNCPEYPVWQGSKLIAQRLDHLGECYELNYVPGGGHSVYLENTHVSLISAFFKRQFCKDCTQLWVEEGEIIRSDTLVGLEEFSFSSRDPQLYPNPAQQEVVFLNWTGAYPKLTLFDLSGRQFRPPFMLLPNGKLRIDLGGLASGCYQVRAEGSGKRLSSRLVIY